MAQRKSHGFEQGEVFTVAPGGVGAERGDTGGKFTSLIGDSLIPAGKDDNNGEW